MRINGKRRHQDYYGYRNMTGPFDFPKDADELVKKIETVRSNDEPEIDQGIKEMILKLAERRVNTISKARLKLWIQKRSGK